MSAVLILLAIDGGLRLVWAGDYADPEPGGSANLYQLTETRHFRRFDGLVGCDVEPNTTLPPGAKPGVFGSKLRYIQVWRHDKSAGERKILCHN
jgi:hypothetical protein